MSVWYRSTPLEVSYALASQLHVPRQDIVVTKHSSESYLTVFELPEQRDRALCKSFIEIGGGVFPIRPWRSAGGPAEMTWWYRVKVSMENVPLEAWNEEGVNLILGEDCIVDRLDRRTQDHESTDILTCYVWMRDPSELLRSMDYTIFATKAGQAMEINGIHVPSTPHDRPLHLDAGRARRELGVREARHPHQLSRAASAHGTPGPRPRR